MSNEIEFVGGLIAKAPNQGAPNYVKAKLSIKREELIEFLQSREGDWINVEVKEGRSGKWYAAIDSWKPEQGGNSGSGPRGGAPSRQRTAPATAPAGDDFADDDIPFLSMRGGW